MTNKLYSIFDRKSCQWQFPVPDTNDDTAVRNVAMSLSSQSLLSFSPADFDLYAVGEFDNESGRVVQYACNTFVMNVSDIIRNYCGKDESHAEKV